MEWKPAVEVSRGGSKYAEYESRVCVHINKRGEFLLSLAAYESLGRPEYVQIVADGNGRLGFRVGKKGVVSTYKCADPGGPVTRLAAKAVSKKYGLTENRTKTMTLYVSDNVLVLNLGQAPQYHD